MVKLRDIDSGQLHELLFLDAPYGIMVIDRQDNAIDANTRACKILGYSKENLLSIQTGDLIHPDDLANTPVETLVKTLEITNEIHLERRYKKSDGTYILATICVKPFRDTQQFLIIFKDISEHKRTEQDKNELETRLYKAQKLEAIGTLAGGIAHDFNNILSGILGSSQLAQINITNPDKLKKNIDQIHKASLRAADLVRHILTFSKESKHKKQPLKVYLVVKEALKLLRSTIPSTIEIKEQLESKASIMADYTQIHQVIMNLCINAYQAIFDNNSTLTIRLKETEVLPAQSIPQLDILPGKYIILEVEDTGCGMDSETIEKIFDPYFTTKEKHNGTGLGLSTVHGIVKNHDGFIKATSKLNKGSIFSLFFPIIQETSSLKTKKTKIISLPRGDENIMVVDDEDSILEPFTGFLEDHGYTVFTFTNGKDALTAFKKEPDGFDLVITDLIMPRLAGDTLSVEMLKQRPDLPIILCSGNIEKITDDLILKSGVKKAILKPIDMESLIIGMRELLDA
ncbi:MAG: response regulator [Desulfobacula sp.]|nr:response regulator [Desulfobacula sp.]